MRLYTQAVIAEAMPLMATPIMGYEPPGSYFAEKSSFAAALRGARNEPLKVHIGKDEFEVLGQGVIARYFCSNNVRIARKCRQKVRFS